MHGGFESTGSQVSHLRQGKKKSIHWFTGTTLPCLSIFKPYVFPIKEQKVLEPGPYLTIDPNWIWSKHTSFLNPYKTSSNVSGEIEYIKKLESVENELFTELDEILIQENTISNNEFVSKMKTLNLKAWDKALNLLI